jgi:diacylglycerol kinase family enzyme
MATRPLVRALTGMLSPRPRPSYPGLPVLHDEDEFTLESDVPLPFQLDGEYLGDRTSVAVGCRRSALTVIAPARRMRNSAE